LREIGTEIVGSKEFMRDRKKRNTYYEAKKREQGPFSTVGGNNFDLLKPAPKKKEGKKRKGAK